MLKDLANYPDGTVIETDIAIIGAGAAGITIAREFIGQNREVWLIESGGLDFDDATQALYKGDITGNPYYALDVARLRYFGGTTNHWGGHCRPLDPIDFEKRSWVPDSGWPITRADLDPFYERAQPVCQLGPYKYDEADWPELQKQLFQFSPEKIQNRIWQFSPPTRFGEVYLPELKRAPNIHVLTNANVVDIAANDHATAIESLHLRMLSGKSATIRPRFVILACGGIENARLLLACDGVEKTGLGNRHDLVGRYFMEHPHAIYGFGVSPVELSRFSAYYSTAKSGTTVFRTSPGVSEALQRSRHLLNGAVDVGWGYDRSSGYMAAHSIGRALKHGDLPQGFGHDILKVFSDLGGTTAGFYRALRHEDVLWFAANTEQVPNPDSRITLESKRDALGMREVKLDWRVTKAEKESVLATGRLLGEELARLDLARIRFDDWILEDNNYWLDLGGRYHHMGTTRMSDDPRKGVVDRNARVHNYENFYIAGSSIFATSGYANPTLTIVALSLRLADHLKQDTRS